jgi:hypothetical protein
MYLLVPDRLAGGRRGALRGVFYACSRRDRDREREDRPRLRRAGFSRATSCSERHTEQLLFAPPTIVRQLEKDQSAIAEGFDEAAVPFADIVGFTPSARGSRRAPWSTSERHLSRLMH